jgi:hypothetical protein
MSEKESGMNEVGFVSAFLDIYPDSAAEESRNRNVQWRLDTFCKLASSGICIYLICSKKYQSYFTSPQFRELYPRVHLIACMELVDTKTWNLINELCIGHGGMSRLQLPDYRNHLKDTLEYMILQHCKAEFVDMAVDYCSQCVETDSQQLQGRQHGYFAWIDFSIVHMFREPEQTLEYIRVMYGPREAERGAPGDAARSDGKEVDELFMIPGCWSEWDGGENMDAILNRIHWRFCGSFFLASTSACRLFAVQSLYGLHHFISKYRRMTWEVNFWAWLEKTDPHLEPFIESMEGVVDMRKWRPQWYNADHNDTVVRKYIWPFLSRPLASLPSGDLRDMILPGGAAIVPDKDWAGSSCFIASPTHGPLLCTRIMNYWIYPNGYYHFSDDDHILRTRNVISTLNSEGLPDMSMLVEDDLGERVMVNQNATAFSHGLEDVRLWIASHHGGPEVAWGNIDAFRQWPPGLVSGSGTDTGMGEVADTPEIRFIATNLNWSADNGRGRMMTGRLQLSPPKFVDAWNIGSPRDAYFEKNWIPFIRPDGSEHFIYQWSPFQMGSLWQPDPAVNKLELNIHTEIHAECPLLWGRVRGSSPFVRFIGSGCVGIGAREDKWLGVVHLSDEGLPRKYAHLLVSLDAEGRPLRYSAPFNFCEKIGVEFCIGFAAFIDRSGTGSEAGSGGGSGVGYGLDARREIGKAKARFWFSRHDRDPAVITVDLDEIPLQYSYARLSDESRRAIYAKPSLIFSHVVVGGEGARDGARDDTGTENGSGLSTMDRFGNAISNAPDHQNCEKDSRASIYILCYNEEVLLPMTIQHYRKYLPNARITICDNMSTDRSVEIAIAAGCRVIHWKSEGQQNEYIQQNLKNEIWKRVPNLSEAENLAAWIGTEWQAAEGWKIVVDMDEWLCVTEADLARETDEGATILRVKGVNVMGLSSDPWLSDVGFVDVDSWNRVVDWPQENKSLCFRTPGIRDMGYSTGAHTSSPAGDSVVYSRLTYYNKHVENMGFPYLACKFAARARRNRIMAEHGINRHYSDETEVVRRRYRDLETASYVLPECGFDPFTS